MLSPSAAACAPTATTSLLTNRRRAARTMGKLLCALPSASVLPHDLAAWYLRLAAVDDADQRTRALDLLDDASRTGRRQRPPVRSAMGARADPGRWACRLTCAYIARRRSQADLAGCRALLKPPQYSPEGISAVHAKGDPLLGLAEQEKPIVVLLPITCHLAGPSQAFRSPSVGDAVLQPRSWPLGRGALVVRLLPVAHCAVRLRRPYP